MNDLVKKLLPCPFCGRFPDIQTLGTSIEIECCAIMSFYKSEFLSREERQTWNHDRATYSEDAEEKAFIAVSKIWNARKLSITPDPDEFPGCPEGCECPSDKGCGIG
jgi:hypothetical protein